MNRRKFIRSLSRTALVLPFADIMALAAPPQQPQQPKIGPQERSYDAKPAPPPPGPKSPIEGTPLGVSFTDVVNGDPVHTYAIVGLNPNTGAAITGNLPDPAAGQPFGGTAMAITPDGNLVVAGTNTSTNNWFVISSSSGAILSQATMG